VTAYTGTFLQGMGVGSFKDLAPFVPGLFIQEQSPNNPGINVRGVTTDSGDPRQETRVSIFQDGVSISRSRGSVVELFDLERVEVLKGPQGTLFGRGAQIGAISIIQNKAQNTNAGQLTAGFGNYGRVEAAGTFNTVLQPNQVFARVAFTYVDRDGSIRNVADGSDLNGKNTLAVRTSLRWQPTSAATALIATARGRSRRAAQRPTLRRPLLMASTRQAAGS
jgi:outer membrane receptor protein involved in Fe transport